MSKRISIPNIDVTDYIQSIEVKKEKLNILYFNDSWKVIEFKMNINDLKALKLLIVKIYNSFNIFNFYFKILSPTQQIATVQDIIDLLPELSIVIIDTNLFGFIKVIGYTENTVKSERDNLIFLDHNVANKCNYFYDEEVEDFIKKN